MCRSAYAVWHHWWAFMARYYTREAWRCQPGPWPVKVVLMALWGLAVLEPGPVGELVMLAVTALYRRAERCVVWVFRLWRARRQAANVSV